MTHLLRPPPADEAQAAAAAAELAQVQTSSLPPIVAAGATPTEAGVEAAAQGAAAHGVAQPGTGPACYSPDGGPPWQHPAIGVRGSIPRVGPCGIAGLTETPVLRVSASR